jgi:hypothetical protein
VQPRYLSAESMALVLTDPDTDQAIDVQKIARLGVTPTTRRARAGARYGSPYGLEQDRVSRRVGL